jgi:hypothetical protein
MSNVKQLTDELAKRLREDLQHLVGRKTSNAQVKKETSLAIQRIMALNESAMYGGEVKWIGTLWEKMTLKEKANWYWKKLSGAAYKEQNRINELNNMIEDQYQKALAEAIEDAWLMGEPVEEMETEDLVLRSPNYEYPNWAHPNPKGVIKVDVVVKPKVGINYISISGQIGDKE